MPDALAADQQSIIELLQLIRLESKHDVSGYKHAAIEARVRRRMQLHRIETLAAYVGLARKTAGEVRQLHQEILIGVTQFFRDDHPHDPLKSVVFPKLRRDKAGAPMRIWVPACATGEEAYSIAICLLEFSIESRSTCPVEIFATDLDERALCTARCGVYGEHIALDVSEQRLQRFFRRVRSGYRIARQVRGMVTFASHDAAAATRFCQLDLVSCRNLLIYLKPEAQRKVLRVFHESLRKGGLLLLGDSETVGDSPDLFSLIDSRSRIYEAK